MKTTLIGLLLLGLCAPTWGQSLTATTTVSPATVTKGQTATLTTVLKNPLTPRPPVTLTAVVTYDDEYDVEHTVTASVTLPVIQPVKPKSYRWSIPALFEFVSGSGKVDGVAVTPTTSGSDLEIPLTRTLAEGETCVVSFSVRAK